MPGFRLFTGSARVWRAAASALGAACGVVVLLPAAHADFELHYPSIDYREFEFEHNADTTFDKRKSGLSNNQSYTLELGYAPVWWWEPEIEGDWDASSGHNLSFNATVFENTFLLTQQGEYWADLGFFAEFTHAAGRTSPDSFTFGPLLQKQASDLFGLDLGRDTLHTLNLLVTKQIGSNREDATPLAIAWQSRLRLNPLFEPGIEYYGQISSIAGASTPDQQAPVQHRLGPALVGQYNMFQYGKVKYEFGYLFGLNTATERGAVRWRFEYEKAF
jgi:hypothetical protein